MIDPVRQEVIATTHTVVIKVGTNVLTNEEGVLEQASVQALADQVQRIMASGRKVVLVSSGAVGAGMGRLGMQTRPTDLRHLQACAAIGQSFLMRAYENCLAGSGIATAQILLTAGDFDHRGRYLNARNTLLSLFEWNCLPIINENDTVSTAEIRFGDNDHLAAMVTNLLQAPLLILLTSVDGLYVNDPSEGSESQIVPTVPTINENILAMAGPSQSRLGSGGMASKLRAARLATVSGESVIIAHGRCPDVLDAIFRAEVVGTLCLPHNNALPAWKRWLGYTAKPKGSLTVDQGAQRAICDRGRSLLPIGVVAVSGAFRKGDVLSILTPSGEEFARGLTNYDVADADRVRGLRTDKIRQLFGELPYEEIVHRDNLVVIE